MALCKATKKAEENSLLTTRAEIVVYMGEDSRLISLECYDFGVCWTFELDNDKKLASMVNSVRLSLAKCAEHLADWIDSKNELCLVRAWSEVEEAYETALSFNLSRPTGAAAGRDKIIYDWFFVDLESCPPPGNCLTSTLAAFTNYLLVTAVESHSIQSIVSKNFILPVCNSVWIFLDLLQQFWTRDSSPGDVIDPASKTIINPRRLTTLTIAKMKNPQLGIELLLPDRLNL